MNGIGRWMVKVMHTLFFFLVAAVAATVWTANPALATPSSPVTGTFVVLTTTTTSTHTADGNTFIVVTRTGALSGTFTGTIADTATLVMYSNGTTSARGEGTCVCSVDGRSGTFDYRFVGSGTFPVSASGQYVLGQGTAGLAGIHGEGPFSGSFAAVTLGGHYQFD